MAQPPMVQREMVPPAMNNGGHHQELMVPEPLDPQFVQQFMAQLKTRQRAIEYNSLLNYEDAVEAGLAQIRRQQQQHQQEVVRLVQDVEHPLLTPQATPAHFPEMRVQTPPQ
ncbi:hypothetical protein B9Z55_023218 [Caenorhabditis nigoni]|uniref:Uncharacterized protein n=1 Tax=Caenorhabditis nigoni TaxID=1611254 RepID=A0A2G5SNN4_9PELO|nr:hypothetical protein B9Z55_023218 [Caenorhabditis nigoni]